MGCGCKKTQAAVVETTTTTSTNTNTPTVQPTAPAVQTIEDVLTVPTIEQVLST